MEHINWIQVVGLVLGPFGAALGAYLGLRVTLVRLETKISNLEDSIDNLKKEVHAVEGRVIERIESDENRIGRIENTYFRGTP